jgi:putative peptide zinc metalloprotease protein
VSDAVVPSSQRPLQLEVRRDLVCEPSVWQGHDFWIVKDPIALVYHRLRAEQYAVLELLDGERSLEAVREAFQLRFPAQRLTLRELRALVVDLTEKGLVVSNRLGRGLALLEREEERRRRAFWRSLRSPLYVKLPGWDPEPVLRAGYPFVRWAFHPLAVLAGCLFVVAAWLTLLVHVEEFQRRLPEFRDFFAWSNLVPLWLLMGAAKVLHEFGHGFACKHHGGECHEIGVAFLVFSPALYCDVSDAWTLPERRKRLAIGLAGMAVELVISAAAFFVWWHTRSGGLHHLALNLFLVTTLTTILFNLNPLLRYDGYYLLCDWLEVPNLRPKADRATRDWFATTCLGIEQPRDPTRPERGGAWFVLYAIAAACYRWFIVLTIVLLLYRMLKPYGLANLGLLLGLVSLGMMLFGVGASLVKVVSAPRRRPMRKGRLACSGAVLAATVCGVLAVPVPRRIGVPVVVEPRGVQHVYAQVDARLQRVHVAAGDVVEAGAPLFDLDAFEPRDVVQRLRTARGSQGVEVAIHRATGDTSNEEVALAGYRSLDERVREHERRLELLAVTAPIAGRIVPPPEVGSRDDSVERGRLRRWTGTLLEERNLGALVAGRTHLVSIAPSDEFQAVVYLDQRKRNEFAEGQAVAIKFEHLPDRTFEGRISAIAPRHVEDVPEQLVQQHGGDLPTVAGPDGERRLESVAYRAIVTIDGDAVEHALLRTGLRGHARITVANRTLGQWCWRYACETFHFRM